MENSEFENLVVLNFGADRCQSLIFELSDTHAERVLENENIRFQVLYSICP